MKVVRDERGCMHEAPPDADPDDVIEVSWNTYQGGGQAVLCREGACTAQHAAACMPAGRIQPAWHQHSPPPPIVLQTTATTTPNNTCPQLAGGRWAGDA